MRSCGCTAVRESDIFGLGYSLRYRRCEPNCMTRLASEHDQPHIRSPFMAADQHPAFGGKAQEDATILLAGLSSHGDLRSAYLDPPGLITSWKIGIFDKRWWIRRFCSQPLRSQ